MFSPFGASADENVVVATSGIEKRHGVERCADPNPTSCLFA